MTRSRILAFYQILKMAENWPVLAIRQGQEESIVPIPGTKRRTYLEENLAALDIELTAEELTRLNEAAPRGVASGPRYAVTLMRFIQSSG